MRYKRIFKECPSQHPVKLLKRFFINHAGLIMNSDREHDVNSAIPLSLLDLKKNKYFFSL